MTKYVHNLIVLLSQRALSMSWDAEHFKLYNSAIELLFSFFHNENVSYVRQLLGFN